MEKARAELVFQVGMVVDSVDEVLENLRSCFDLEEDSVDFEYIEPLNKEGGDPYSDWLRAHGQGIHHINLKLKDRSVLDRMMEERNIHPHLVTKVGDLALETYDFRRLFGFIGELGDMVVGPMAKAYYEEKN